MSLEQRIAAYLDGELDEREAAEVESALADPAVAALLSEELMLRHLLESAPPEAPSEELISRLEQSLGVGDGLTDRVKSTFTTFAGKTPPLRPTALAAARMTLGGARVAASSIGTMRHSLELVRDLPSLRRSPQKSKSMWRRAATLLLRRRK